MTQPTAFLHGWLQLPGELKIAILRFAVPAGKKLTRPTSTPNAEVSKSSACDSMLRYGTNLT